MRRSIYSLIIGVALAGVAVWLLINSRPNATSAQASAPGIATVKVMVAAKDLDYGDKVVADYVKAVDWPQASVPKDAILTRAELLEGPEAPRIALRSIAAGEPYLKTRVSGFGERPTLSRKVAAGMRAFTVRINDVSGVAGFILPGDHVDIILTRRLENRTDPQAYATDVLLQNVTVLGIDQLSNENAEKPVLGKSATFEVTPEQAQKLALGVQVGTLSLSLRNYQTIETTPSRQIAVNDLGERRAAPVAPKKSSPAPAPAPARDTSIYVRVRKGTEVEQERVQR